MTQQFGTTTDGQDVHRIQLHSDDLSVGLLTLGACLQEVRLAGQDRNLTLGFPSLDPYLTAFPHAGTIMGPVANRIAGASAVIDGEIFKFDADFLGKHTLHGGQAATHTQVWSIDEQSETDALLTLDLPHGAGGFPGNRKISARFQVEGPSLSLTLDARTDQPTLMNLANHSYWNLGTEPTAAGHILTVQADHYLPTGNETELLPSGEIASVDGTRFDYRNGRVIEAGAEGLLDNNLCLSKARGPLRQVATLTAPNGTCMNVATTEPGLQIFDGHILGEMTTQTTDGRQTQPCQAFALEAQFWPDAPNHPYFPDIVLRPGETWQQITQWTFQA